MDDPVHGRRAAIYVNERKPLPPSFYWGLTVALAIHVGGAYYLLQTRFTHTLPEVIPDPVVRPTSITMERPDKPKPAPPNTVRVHKPEQIMDHADPVPLIPQKVITVVDGPVVPPILPDNAGSGTSSGVDGGSTGTEPVQFVKARWSRFPDGAALAEYYPQKATDNEVEGQATVQCAVLDNTGRVSCVVVSESPGNYGFGAATVRMVQDKGRVDTTQGGATKGAILRQTVAWKLN